MVDKVKAKVKGEIDKVEAFKESSVKIRKKGNSND